MKLYLFADCLGTSGGKKSEGKNSLCKLISDQWSTDWELEMKGKPTPKSPKKGAQEKATAAGGASPKKAQAAAAAGQNAGTKPQGKRKLVYRYGQNSQQGSPATPATPTISVLEAAQAVMKQNMEKTTGKVQVKKKPKIQLVSTADGGVEVIAAGDAGEDGDVVMGGFDLEVSSGKRVVKSIPGQSYIQEVRSETGK